MWYRKHNVYFFKIPFSNHLSQFYRLTIGIKFCLSTIFSRVLIQILSAEILMWRTYYIDLDNKKKYKTRQNIQLISSWRTGKKSYDQSNEIKSKLIFAESANTHTHTHTTKIRHTKTQSWNAHTQRRRKINFRYNDCWFLSWNLSTYSLATQLRCGIHASKCYTSANHMKWISRLQTKNKTTK